MIYGLFLSGQNKEMAPTTEKEECEQRVKLLDNLIPESAKPFATAAKSTNTLKDKHLFVLPSSG
jgi:hypothetical protein